MMLAINYPLRLPLRIKHHLYHFPIPFMLVEPIVVIIKQPILNRDTYKSLIAYNMSICDNRKIPSNRAEQGMIIGAMRRVVIAIRHPSTPIPGIDKESILPVVSQLRCGDLTRHIRIKPEATF